MPRKIKPGPKKRPNLKAVEQTREEKPEIVKIPKLALQRIQEAAGAIAKHMAEAKKAEAHLRELVDVAAGAMGLDHENEKWELDLPRGHFVKKSEKPTTH